MTILIVDDDELKTDQLRAFCLNCHVEDVDACSNGTDALLKMRDQVYDLVLLDVVLPEVEDGPPVEDGYRKVLHEVKSGRHVQRPMSLIGLTQFTNRVEEAFPDFAEQGFLLLQFSDSSNWQQIVRGRLAFLSDKRNISLLGKGGIVADVVIITALSSPELSAVLEIPWDWKEIAVAHDFQKYYWAEVQCKHARINVVVGCAQLMGLVNASALAIKMCLQFKPKWALMTGIAGGIKGKCGLGDILFVDSAFHHESGKVIPETGIKRALGLSKFISDQRVEQVTAKAKNIYSEKKRIEEAITIKWRELNTQKPATPPNIVCGAVASGSVVVADAQYIQSLTRNNRSLVGVEMECYGFYYGCRQASNDAPNYLCMKGVCDLADDSKNDKMQAYSAIISARAAAYVIENGLLV